MRKNFYFMMILVIAATLLAIGVACDNETGIGEPDKAPAALFTNGEAIEYLKEWIREEDDNCDLKGSGTYHQPFRHWEVEERTSAGIIVLSLELSKSRGNNPNAKEDKDHFRPASKREQRYLIDGTENKITRINEKYYQNTNNSFDEPSWRLRTVYSKFKC